MKRLPVTTLAFLSLVLGLVPGGSVARADVDLWPLFEWTDESKVILYPLFVSEDDFLMVAPFYYRTHERRDHHILWPLLKFSDGDLVRAAPVWFRGENRFTLFPLIHRTEDYTLLGLPPAYVRHDGSFRAVLPFFARSKHTLITFPGYYRVRRPGEPRIDGLFPLVEWRRGEGERTWDLLASSFRRGERPGEREWWAFWMVGSIDRPERSVRWAYPFYLRLTDHRNGARTLFLMPYLQTRAPKVSRTWLFPFFLSTTRTPASGGSDRWHSILWPVYSREELREADGRLTRRNRRFLIFSDTYEEGKRTFSIFGLPVVERL